MVRGQCPSDYLIMVPAAPENLCDLSEKAQKLLEAGHSVKVSVKLTRRLFTNAVSGSVRDF
jgi:hypothetical protein